MKLKDIAVGVTDLLKIDPRLLHVDPGFNVRLDGPELDEANQQLRESIRAKGVQTPFKVRLRDDQAVIVDGHRRHAAVMALISEGVAIETVPCLPEGKYVSDADRTMMLITTNSGHPLTALEKAIVFKRLLGHGWSIDKIATESGYSSKQVENLLTLGAAPEEVKEMVSSGQVSATTATKMLKKEGGTKTTAALKEAVQVAKAAGKEKVTAKTLKPVATPAAPPTPAPSTVSPFDIAAMLGGTSPAATNDTGDADEPGADMVVEPRSTIKNTPAKFQELVSLMHEVLNTDNVAMIHTMVRDVLNLRAAKAA